MRFPGHRSIKMIVFLALAIASTSAGLAAEEAGVRHRYFMKGQLLEVDGQGVYLCVGTDDGARSGQQVEVFRYGRAKEGNPKAAPRFERKQIGRIEIVEVVDEHFARAKVLAGDLRVGDVAELEMERAAAH